MTTTNAHTDDYGRALEQFRAGNYDTALVMLQRLAIGDPGERTIYGIAMCHARLGQWEAAERTLAQLVQQHPERTEYAEELRTVREQVRRGQVTPPADVHPSTLGADTGGASPSTLAGILEEPGGDHGLADFTGDLLVRRHRMLLSHRRLWLGVLLVTLLPVVGWLEGEIRDAASTPSNGVQDVAATVLDVFASLTVLLLAIAAALVGAAVLNSRLTTYVVWAHRVDVTTGVLFRRHRTVWLYKLTDVQLTQNPVLLLAGTAALTLYVDEGPNASRTQPKLVGLAPASAMHRLQDQLLFLAAQERRGMKKQFI